MAELLSEAGYATGMYGKWHLSRTPGRFPTDQGFEEWYGIPNTTDESVYSSLAGFAKSGLPQTFVLDAKKREVPKKVRPYNLDYRPLIDRDLTDRAITFMKRQVGKSGSGLWGDMLMQIDSYVGDLLDAIDDLGITKNTIFIFTADNGPEALEANGTSMTVETAVHGSAGPWRGTLFTGFEGALRVPFVARWPGKIAPDTSSDEIVHEMDLFPTLAKIAGGKVPDDRIIDGIDVSDFLIGKTKKSGRDGFIVYMGNDVFGVKWRNWKIHFKEQDSWNGKLREYTMPRVYNLMSDPQEKDNVLFPHTWVPKAALGQLVQHTVSLKTNPPIKAGTKDPYKPPY